jgi:hypothetical protein
MNRRERNCKINGQDEGESEHPPDRPGFFPIHEKISKYPGVEQSIKRPIRKRGCQKKDVVGRRKAEAFVNLKERLSSI